MSLETQIMHWIGEALPSGGTVHALPVVPVKRLVRKFPEYRKATDPNLTDSMIISFQTFDSATIYRTIRHLEKRGFVELVEQVSEETGEANDFVRISAEGVSELARLRTRKLR